MSRPKLFDGPPLFIRLTADESASVQRDADRCRLPFSDVIRQRLWWSYSSEALEGDRLWQSWDEHIEDFAIQKRASLNGKKRMSQRRHNEVRLGRIRASFVEKIDRRRVYALSNGMCGICGDPIDDEQWQVDHVVPLARGGAHSYANVQASHRICNLRKGAS